MTSSGIFSATIPARTAVALHVNAMGTGGTSTVGSGSGSGTTIAVNFQEMATTTFGEVCTCNACSIRPPSLYTTGTDIHNRIEHIPRREHLTAGLMGYQQRRTESYSLSGFISLTLWSNLNRSLYHQRRIQCGL